MGIKYALAGVQDIEQPRPFFILMTLKPGTLLVFNENQKKRNFVAEFYGAIGILLEEEEDGYKIRMVDILLGKDKHNFCVIKPKDRMSVIE